MAPGRRKGANRSKTKAQLQLGDLVLAKVKGFPAWPAKISRPEDWDRLPDPKKYFVQFFGTFEIAYVAPADVQLFTNESKSKLSARSRSKSVKYFARAVEEICEAFEELHEKKKDEPGEDPGQTVASISSSTDGLKDSKHLEHYAIAHNGPGEITEQQESDKNVCSMVELHGLERSSQNREGIIVNIAKASSTGMESPVTSARRRKKALSSQALKDAKVIAAKSTPNPFSVKQEYFITHPNVSCAEIKMEETSPKGSTGGRNQQLCLSGDYECSPFLSKSLISKNGGAEKVVENGHGAKMVNTELRRKVENSLLVKKCRASLELGDVSTEDNIELPEHKEGFGQEDNNISPCDSARESSESTSQLVVDGHNEKISKCLKNSRAQSSSKILLHEDSSKLEQNTLLGNVVEGLCEVFEGEKSQFRKKKHKMAGTEKSSPAKRAKCMEVGGDISKGSRVNGLSHCVPENKDVEIVRSDKSTCVKSVDHLASRTEYHEDKSQLPSKIAVLPPKKQCHRRPEALPCSAPKNAADMTKKISLDKDEMQISDQDTSLVAHHRPRRRLLQYDDDDKEEHTSPVQREPPNNLMSAQSNIADSVRKSDSQSECHRDSSSNLNTVVIEKLSSECKERTSDVKPRSGEFEGGSCSSSPRTREDRSDALELLAHRPGRSEYKKSSYGEGKSVIVSPKTSVGPSPAARATDHKSINTQSKLLALKAKKAQASTSKLSSKALERSNHSQKQLVNQKNKSSSSEKLKVTPKSKAKTPLIAENRSAVNFSAECNIENIIPVEGLDVAKEHEAASNASSLINNKLTDSSTSMKRLIAAAQAKRRQARSQYLISDAIIPFSVSTPPMIHGQSPSPISAVHNFSSGNSVPKVTKWSQFAVSSGSPSSLSQEPLSENQAEPKDFEHRVTPGYQPAGDSLNGGTEAVVARDTLEGMLETLSRTRDSIGRATRLAIDCAKYGIAREVVELIIRKLESEPNHYRRVDFFFLVDSITQCSHSHKGIAESSYIPTVQAALPRLLAAVAPSGACYRENRRQCLKVLRLWLERKILPESIIRRYMDEIEIPNDEMGTGSLLRRPSRAERSIDDPLRNMEGMLVDEYGSNATIQLPGFLLSKVFDDQDLDGCLSKDTGNEPAAGVMNASEEPYADVVTPSDRHQCILADVDVEFKMEDVSTSKDEKSIPGNDPLRWEHHHQDFDRAFELTMNGQSVFPPLPAGPPLPLDSPPPPPPLPPSPPPPSPPPPLSPSPPPPPSSPPPASLLLASLPPPPAPSSRPPYVYHPSMPQDHCWTTSDNQSLQMSGNAPIQEASDSVVKSGMVLQQPSSFLAAGICSTQSVSGFISSRPCEYGYGGMYLASQASYPNQQFQPGSASIQQRPYHPLPPPQTPTGHPLPSTHTPANCMPFVPPLVQQHVQEPHSLFNLPSLPTGQKPYANDEQWRVHSSNVHPDNQYGSLVAGGRMPPCPGFFRPNMDRPPSNPVGFQVPLHNSLPSGASIQGPPGHSITHMLPSRPEVLSLNCWRPA